MFTNINRDIMHLILAAVLWLIVSACAVSSIYSQTRLDRRHRKLWAGMIIGLPLLGLLIYLPFSLENPKILQEWLNKLFPGRAA